MPPPLSIEALQAALETNMVSRPLGWFPRPRDYQGIARRAFLVEKLPDGALPIYDRDPEPDLGPSMWDILNEECWKS